MAGAPFAAGHAEALFTARRQKAWLLRGQLPAHFAGEKLAIQA